MAEQSKSAPQGALKKKKGVVYPGTMRGGHHHGRGGKELITLDHGSNMLLVAVADDLLKQHVVFDTPDAFSSYEKNQKADVAAIVAQSEKDRAAASVQLARTRSGIA